MPVMKRLQMFKRKWWGLYAPLSFLLVFFVVLDLTRVHDNTAGPVITPTPYHASSQPKAPTDVPVPGIDLTNWYLTLPVTCDQVATASCRGDANGAGEIFQPDLASFSSPYFYTDLQNKMLVFRADVEGVTTSGSNYPRSELREMVNNGTQHASWSTANGINTMVATETVEQLPIVKPQVVTAQIHNASGEVIEVLAEALQSGPPTKHTQYRICVRFGANGGKETGPCLDNSYTLGTFYTINITASNGVIRIWYAKGTTAPDVSKGPTWQEAYVGDGDYFKIGAYTQSNLKAGDKAGAYGEVGISKLVVTHQ